MIADVVTDTPSTDPTNCTVEDLSQNPGRVPSCDMVSFKNVRFVFSGATSPVLNIGEVQIGLIGSVVAQARTNPTTGANDITFVWRYSTYNLLDMVARVGMRVNRFGNTQSGTLFGTNSSGGNISMWDYQQLLIDYLERTASRLEYLINAANANITSLSNTINSTNATVSSLQTSYNAYVQSNNTAVTALQANAFVPIGGVIMYSGGLSNFDLTGRGLTNTPMARWAICNGQNGTPDLRDRFVMGYSPTSPMGTTGGANQVTLTGRQSGVNTHTHFFRKSTNNAVSNVIPIPEGAEFTNAPGAGNYGRGNPYPLVEIENAARRDADDPHENRPAFMALAFLMRIQ
jgi:microcystin-dependent protein